MNLRYRPIKVWPEGWQNQPRDDAPWSPFKSDWQSTLRLLDDEVRHLGADEATLQLDTAEGNCRADGSLRGDAKVNYHGVILVVDTPAHGVLTYPCNKFDSTRDPWRQNVRAIALGLESLRRVERYGIADRGQQYAGYAELPSGIPLGRASMTRNEAAVFIAEHTGLKQMDGGDLQYDERTANADLLAQAFRMASKRLHPDNGGDPAMFDRLVAARDLLMENAR